MLPAIFIFVGEFDQSGLYPIQIFYQIIRFNNKSRFFVGFVLRAALAEYVEKYRFQG